MDLSRVVWRKASLSKEDGSNCIELAGVPGRVAIRDSKDPNGPKLIIDHGDFQNFASVLKSL
ncbi:DUF397 domain-containing protein [Actinomadura sp. 7K507]|uniref:DUF397 domain-containing protein n=1 Tax=Actinomadura sp. 7K507 TaxID=2530365 RepID=UPI00104E4DDB|nr:DUF397 domain-containing protein [Actinomadura sp. 7K507]TDC74679.1 DUF397 domain-containing protein [Actinomadura sp. 7K507]